MPQDQIQVNLIDWMGDDSRVAQSARVSFKKQDLGHSKDDNTRLIKYLAKHKHNCYDSETEVFTDKGWVKFSNLTELHLVAEVYGWDEDNFSFNFVAPLSYHCSYYEGSMVSVSNSGTNYKVTPNHRMLFQNRLSTGFKGWEVGLSGDQVGRVKRLRNTASLSRLGTGTYDEGWLKGFILADGFRRSSTSIGIRLKKERKIEALSNALIRLGVEYKVIVTEQGVTQFSFKSEIARDLKRSWGKSLSESDWGKSSDYLKGVLHGVLFGDGSVKHGGWSFTTTSINLLRDVERLSTIGGYQTREISKPDPSVNCRQAYGLDVLSRHCSTINKSRGNEEFLEDYRGLVYCVTVPSGMLLVRREGKQIVCGNSPFGHCFASFHVKAPIFVVRQLVKHKFLRLNEVSRRYIDTDVEFYTPDTLRGKPVNKKQGSNGEVTPLGFWSDETWQDNLTEQHSCSLVLYNHWIDSGVAPEQARMVLPLSLMTEIWWSGSLDAFADMAVLRLAEDTQYETRLVAQQIDEAMKQTFPVSWDALLDRPNEAQ